MQYVTLFAPPTPQKNLVPLSNVVLNLKLSCYNIATLGDNIGLGGGGNSFFIHKILLYKFKKCQFHTNLTVVSTSYVQDCSLLQIRMINRRPRLLHLHCYGQQGMLKEP